MNSSIWFFENIDVFQMLCPHRYKEYSDEHELSKYKKGDYIYFTDDSANKVYLITSGKVKMGYVTETGEEIITSILSKGEIFGEKSILGEEKRNEFAQSIDNSTSICIVPLDIMYQLLRSNDEFSLKVYKFIGYRFKKVERRLQLMLFKDAKTRVKEFINELSIDYGKDTNQNLLQINHPYTQKDIATLLGISRPTLNILLNELKTEGYLNFHRNQIIIKKS